MTEYIDVLKSSISPSLTSLMEENPDITEFRLSYFDKVFYGTICNEGNEYIFRIGKIKSKSPFLLIQNIIKNPAPLHIGWKSISVIKKR